MSLLNLSDWKEFFNYWLLNEGLVLPLLAVAAVICRRFDKKVLLAVMAVFVWGNTFQLSRDLGGHNHKVINLWEVLSGLFVGYALVEIATFGYAASARLGRLRTTLRAPEIERNVAVLAGSVVALVGAGVVLIGLALPWFATQDSSASALKLLFGHWESGGAVVLQNRPGFAVFPLLALLIAWDAVAGLASGKVRDAWVRAAAGLGLVILGVAFAVAVKADLTTAAIRPGVYVTIIGGAIVFSSALMRPNLTIRIDMDPFRAPAIALCTVAFAFLVVSGLVDFMTVKNDFKVRVFGDPPEPEAIQWINDNTPKDAVFLTDSGPALHRPDAGRPERVPGLLSWARSAGYDVTPRAEVIPQIYAATDKAKACSLLTQNDIDYVDDRPGGARGAPTSSLTRRCSGASSPWLVRSRRTATRSRSTT